VTIDESFDVSYRFDERLREVPNDREALARATAALEDRLASGTMDARGRARALGVLGGYRRLLGRLDDAAASLHEAVAVAGELGDERLLLTNRLRLAHVFQWQRRFAEADVLFASVVAGCEGHPDRDGLLAFALQHAGKSLFDQERYAEAAARFARAVALREAAGDAELIASSRIALDTARARQGR
jgi:tetratricopeptide (TPR) repeat protein